MTSEMRPGDWEVPEFKEEELFERKHKYCVVIPVINEGERIQAQLRDMETHRSSLDVIIADGGSTDDSVRPDFLRKYEVRTLLTKVGPGRLSAQIRMGLAYALREKYEGIILMDGNNKDDPASLPAFLYELLNGADHVQGSRYIAGGKAVNTPWFRHFAVRCIHAPLISWSAGYRYTDTTNGFRAYSATFLKDPRVAVFRNVFTDYELHYYLAIRAAQLGFKVKEIPVTRTYPSHGKIPTKIDSVSGYLGILNDLFNACMHRYDPK